MKTVKVKQKKTAEKKDIAGTIVGLIFLSLLIAAGYYMFDMFRSRPITSDGIAGDWHHTAELNEKNTDHWVFNNDGTAMSYTLNNDTKERTDEKTYTYTIRIAQEKYQEYIDSGILKKDLDDGRYKDRNKVVYSPLDDGKTQAEVVVTTSNVRKSEEQTYAIRVTLLSKAEMDVIYIYDRFTTDTTRLTKKLF